MTNNISYKEAALFGIVGAALTVAAQYGYNTYKKYSKKKKKRA